MSQDTSDAALASTNRRGFRDRRRRTWYALLLGNFTPRRRRPRRHNEAHIAAVDWHDRRWLFVAGAIMLMSTLDAVLTLALLEKGASEANPLMAALIGSDGPGFAAGKLLLTAAGVVMLTLMAQLRAFGRVPVSLILYTLLCLYGALLVYEVWLYLRLSRPA